jgi:hypothetical protein
MTNAVIERHCVPRTAEAYISINPKAIPPAKAPRILPIPPRTAAVKAVHSVKLMTIIEEVVDLV